MSHFRHEKFHHHHHNPRTMTDVSRMPPHVATLFTPRPPLRHVEPSDYGPEQRKNCRIDGIAGFLASLEEAANEDYEPTESWLQKQQREKKDKQLRNKEMLQQRLRLWDPSKDLHVRGDPHKTLFIGRLSYKTTEQDLQKEFERFGPIERVRIVSDQNGKPRGYAFVVYERVRDMEMARRDMHARIIHGRPILTDKVRARVDPKFKPRSLGGDLGGRNRGAAAKREFGRGFRDRDRGLPPPRRFNDRPPRFRDGNDRRKSDRPPPPPRYRDREPRDHRPRGGGGGSYRRDRDRDYSPRRR